MSDEDPPQTTVDQRGSGGAIAGSWFEPLMVFAGFAWVLTGIIAFVQWNAYRSELGRSGPSNTEDIARAGHAIVLVMPWFVGAVGLTALAVLSAIAGMKARPRS